MDRIPFHDDEDKPVGPQNSRYAQAESAQGQQSDNAQLRDIRSEDDVETTNPHDDDDELEPRPGFLPGTTARDESAAVSRGGDFVTHDHWLDHPCDEPADKGWKITNVKSTCNRVVCRSANVQGIIGNPYGDEWWRYFDAVAPVIAPLASSKSKHMLQDDQVKRKQSATQHNNAQLREDDARAFALHDDDGMGAMLEPQSGFKPDVTARGGDATACGVCDEKDVAPGRGGSAADYQTAAPPQHDTSFHVTIHQTTRAVETKARAAMARHASCQQWSAAARLTAAPTARSMMAC